MDEEHRNNGRRGESNPGQPQNGNNKCAVSRDKCTRTPSGACTTMVFIGVHLGILGDENNP